jgi:hypothetical protein
MPDIYSLPLPTTAASSSSFSSVAPRARFDSPKPAAYVKRIDFPIRPYLLKYLQVNLRLSCLEADASKLEDYVLSTTNRFGFALDALLRKPAKSARHEGSVEDCTAVLGVNLRNFNAAYYDLTRGALTEYAIFKFNDFVDDNLNADLYFWVARLVGKRSTIKDAIRSFMVFYDISEDEKSFESLRKNVQRNAPLPALKKKKAKAKNFSVNVSQKIGEVSRKKRVVSPKTGVLSQKDTFEAVRQHLMSLPIALFETPFYHAHSS